MEVHKSERQGRWILRKKGLEVYRVRKSTKTIPRFIMKVSLETTERLGFIGKGRVLRNKLVGKLKRSIEKVVVFTRIR